MHQSQELGVVKELWRFPVKSMRGEKLKSAYVDETGLCGDRAFALLDVELDKIVTAKSIRRFPNIFEYRATYSRTPIAGEPLPPVNIELPGGDVVSSASEGFDEVLSAKLGQAVKLKRVGERGSAPYHDASPLSVLTDSTLERLRQLQPESDFDVRRFRMNVIVDGNQAGFVENEWIGLTLRIGENLRLRVTEPNARCVMTTLALDGLPADREIFAAMVKHNRLEMENGRRFPCAGVYTEITSAGTVNISDTISI